MTENGKFEPKEFSGTFGSKRSIYQKFLFDHKNKVVVVRGIWLKKDGRETVRYKVIDGNNEEKIDPEAEIPEIPEFGRVHRRWKS